MWTASTLASQVVLIKLLYIVFSDGAASAGAAEGNVSSAAGPVLVAADGVGGRQMPSPLTEAECVPAALHWCALGQPSADNEKRQRSTHTDVARLLIGAPGSAHMLSSACLRSCVCVRMSGRLCLTRGALSDWALNSNP